MIDCPEKAQVPHKLGIVAVVDKLEWALGRFRTHLTLITGLPLLEKRFPLCKVIQLD